MRHNRLYCAVAWGAGVKLGFVLGITLGLTACVSSSIEQIRHTKTGTPVTKTESVVILGRRQHNNHETENSFLECVSDELNDGQMSVISEKKFQDQMFPWFEPRVAPLTTDSLPRLIAQEAVAERLRQTGVRYIVWLDGTTEDGDNGGSMSCAAGPAGGGCLGLLWWEKNAAYEASIWDMHNSESVGKVSVDAKGTSYVPAFIIPIPLIARTQSAACDGVANQVREFLQTGN